MLPHLKEGSSIINTSSITAFKGNPQLVDYASTKGAQVTCCAPAGAASQDATLLACMQQICPCLARLPLPSCSHSLHVLAINQIMLLGCL